jgi:hypothetical protein
MPTDWGASLGGGFLGRVRYVRRFNQPSGIKPAVQVWLVFDGADARADVTLNDRPLGRVEGASRAEFDVTSLLRQHNVVTAVVEKGPADDRGDRVHLPGGLIGEVRLEFRGPDAGWLDREKMAERDSE